MCVKLDVIKQIIDNIEFNKIYLQIVHYFLAYPSLSSIYQSNNLQMVIKIYKGKVNTYWDNWKWSPITCITYICNIRKSIFPFPNCFQVILLFRFMFSQSINICSLSCPPVKRFNLVIQGKHFACQLKHEDELV